MCNITWGSKAVQITALALWPLIAVASVFSVACGKQSPTSATRTVQVVEKPWVPQHNNIIATFAGDPQGPLVYLCATQLRSYTNAEGVAMQLEDHYLQYEPCPTVPIE
jgi:hypothetical protein